MPFEADLADRPVHVCGADTEDGGVVAQPLAYRQVEVDAQRLGHIADLVPKPLAASRNSEHRHRAGGDDLGTDDRSQEGRLAAATGPEQAGHRAGADATGDARQDRTRAATDHKVDDVDRGRLFIM